MSKKQSEFLKAFGVAFNIFKAITDAVLEAGGTDEDVRSLITPAGKGKLAKIAAILVEKPAVQPVAKPNHPSYPVVVDHTRSLAVTIEAGRYDWKNGDITAEHFPVPSTCAADVETFTVHFGRDMTTEQVLAVLDAQDFKPAGIAELLAFGKKYPDLQRQFPIVALGSVWRYPGGRRHCPYLDGGGRGRGLGLSWLGDHWHGDYRFLAVRKRK